MGDIAAYYSNNYRPQTEEERNLEREADDIRANYKAGRLDWINKDGDKFPISTMTDVYVLNVLKYLEEYPYEKHADTYAWIWVFKQEKSKRKIK